MKEIELLKELLNLEKEKHVLEIQISISKNDVEVYEIRRNLDEIINEIETAINKLKEVKVKSSSFQSREGMIRQLDSYISEIKKAQPGLKLLRNQGLILEDYLFSRIINDLQYFLTSNDYYCRIPAYLYYTFLEENSVEIESLIDFFEEEKQNLREIQNVDFLELRVYFEGFKERILRRFVE